jgi:6-phosphogluconolactonase/glucosamine-6-phosphate isomerase/deaminase
MDLGFSLPGAKLQPVLTGAGSVSDAADFAAFLSKQLEEADFALGQFGIGPDGHTAGLPAKGAAPSDALADYYKSDVFLEVAPAQPDRISITPAGISRLTEAIACVRGESRHHQLDRLAQNLPYAEQSSQALKLAPKCTIFNDLKGESA